MAPLIFAPMNAVAKRYVTEGEEEEEKVHARDASYAPKSVA